MADIKSFILNTSDDLKTGLAMLLSSYRNPEVRGKNGYSYGTDMDYERLRRICKEIKYCQIQPLMKALNSSESENARKAFVYLQRHVGTLVSELPTAFLEEQRQKTESAGEIWNGLSFEQKIELSEENYNRLKKVANARGVFGKKLEQFNRNLSGLQRFLKKYLTYDGYCAEVYGRFLRQATGRNLRSSASLN